MEFHGFHRLQKISENAIVDAPASDLGVLPSFRVESQPLAGGFERKNPRESLTSALCGFYYFREGARFTPSRFLWKPPYDLMEWNF